MRLNMFLEHLPGQEAQVEYIGLKMNEVLDGRGISTTLVGSDLDLENPFELCGALARLQEHLVAQHTVGVVVWHGTLPSLWAKMAKQYPLERYNPLQEARGMKMFMDAARSTGVPSPDVIVVPKPLTEGEYGELVERILESKSKQTLKRWWKNGSTMLSVSVARTKDWLPEPPLVVTADYSDPELAVTQILRELPESLLENYRQGGGVHLTENEKFMGLTPLEVKVPKKYLIQIQNEATSRNVSLDSHVSAILKKYLLEDIISPPQE